MLAVCACPSTHGMMSTARVCSSRVRPHRAPVPRTTDLLSRPTFRPCSLLARRRFLPVLGLLSLFHLVTPSLSAAHAMSFEERREKMVTEDIERRGIRNPRVLDALRKVERHRFVPDKLAAHAYRDGPLPIGHGQTISQPYMVASMVELLDPQPGDRILDVGTGSGYQAAVLSGLVSDVYGIEIVPQLAAAARKRLAALGYSNVHVFTGDGWHGLPEHAPYDGIVVAASAEEVVKPLVKQLVPGGKLVIPVGERHGYQELRVIEAVEGGYTERDLYPVGFVPLIHSSESASSDGTRTGNGSSS